MVDEKKIFFGKISRTLENAILENNQTTVFLLWMIALKTHIDHRVYWRYKHPLKNTIPFPSSLPSPPLNQQIVQAPSFLGNSPPYIGFLQTPSP